MVLYNADSIATRSYITQTPLLCGSILSELHCDTILYNADSIATRSYITQTPLRHGPI